MMYSVFPLLDVQHIALYKNTLYSLHGSIFKLKIPTWIILTNYGFDIIEFWRISYKEKR